MTINDFFIGDTLDINWEFVLKLPHFCDLEKTQQNPRWHSEGNALEHTKLCVENMYNFMIDDVRSTYYKRLMMLSALFHDIGKPSTTFMGEDGNWHSYVHEKVGAKLTREMLWDWKLYDREFISHMVLYHMEPLFVFKQKDPDKAIKRMMSVLPYKSLYYLKMSDLLAAVQDPEFSTKEQDKQIVENFLTRCDELHIENDLISPSLTMLNFINDKDFVSTSLGDFSIRNFPQSYSGGFLHIMIGLPGSGKNTWIEYLKAKSYISADAVILSRDDIRVELGYCTADEKIVGTDEQEKKVTKIFNERLNAAMKEKKDIVVNNINLSEKRRKALKNQCSTYSPVYWYVEAPTFADNLSRRDGQIGEEVFHNMIKNFDFPQVFECDLLNIYKQSKDM
jgi:putative nucleotidyltransferase with HDIG domain